MFIFGFIYKGRGEYRYRTTSVGGLQYLQSKKLFLHLFPLNTIDQSATVLLKCGRKYFCSLFFLQPEMKQLK